MTEYSDDPSRYFFCGGQLTLFSEHAYAETPPVIWHLSSDTCPYPKNSYHRHYSLVCVRVGMVGRCPWRWFSGDMWLGGGKCPASITYKCCYNFIRLYPIRLNLDSDSQWIQTWIHWQIEWSGFIGVVCVTSLLSVRVGDVGVTSSNS